MEFDQQDFNYNQLDAIRQIELQNKEKSEKFKERVKQFETISTLKEAKDLANKILPVAKEFCSFKVGNAKCTVVNKDDMFRICVDTADEFISYDFA